MRIGLDLDGCLANIDQELIWRMKQAGYESDINNWHSYFLEENHPEIPVEWIVQQFNDPLLWHNAIPYEDAWYTVNKWLSNHEVFIITCRGVANFRTTQDWLEKWRVDHTELYCGAAKYHKNWYAEKLNLDVFIEDDPQEAKILSQTMRSFLIDRPYNRRYDTGDAIRVQGFYELEKFV